MAGRQPLSSIVNVDAIQSEVERVRGFVRTLQEDLDNVFRVGDNYKANTRPDGKKSKEKEDTDALAAANEKLLQSRKLLDAEKEKAIRLETDLAKQIAIQQELNKKRATDMRAEARETAGLNDAYRKLELQYNAAQRAAKNLAATPGTPKEAIEEANRKALALSDQLKSIDAAVGQHQRKVGDYVGAISILDKTLQQTNNRINQMGQAQAQNSEQSQALMAELNGLTASGQENSKAWLQIRGEIDKLNKTQEQYVEEQSQLSQQTELLNELLNQQAKGFTSVAMEIRANERALFTLKEAGMEDSEAFKQIQKSVAAAHRELNEFNKQQKILESADPTLKAATIAAKGLAGAYAVGAGAAALFADGDEKVEKELNKLVAIMTVLQGLQEASELLHQRNAIAIAFETGVTHVAEAAQRIWASTMLTSTAATVAFRVALIALTGGLLLLIPLVGFAFTKMADTMKDARLEQEALEEVNKKAIDGYAEEQIKIKMVVAQLKDENISRKTKKEMIDDLKKQYPDYLDNIENEGKLTKDLADAIEKRLIPALELEAKAKAAQELASEKYKKMLELQQDPTEALSIWEKAGAYLKNFGNVADASLSLVATAQKDVMEESKELQDQIDALFKVALKADEQLSKLKGKKTDEDILNREYKARIALLNLIREQAIEELKPVEENKEGPAGPRIKAMQQEFALRKAIIESNRDVELHNEKLLASEKLVIRQKAANEIFKLETELAVNLWKVRADELEKLHDDQKQTEEELAAAQEAYFKSHENAIKAAAAQQKNYIDEAAEIELKALDKKYEQGLVDEDEYNKKKKKITDDALKYTLQANLKEIEAQKALAIAKNQTLPKDQQIDTSVYDAQAAKIRENLEQITLDDILAKKKAYADKVKKIVDDVTNYEKKAEDTIAGFVKAASDRKINDIQGQIDANNRLKDSETERIATSTLSEQQKANTLIVLNARVAAENEILVQKQNQVKERQARFDKDKNVFDIILNTAASIVKTGAELGYPLAIPFQVIAGVEGAAQLAVALAQPLPKFWTGTKSSPEGPAWVGERGTELLRYPSGELRYTPPSATLTYLPNGTEVISNPELRRMQMAVTLQNDSHMTAASRTDNNLIHEVIGVQKGIEKLQSSLGSKLSRPQQAPVTIIKINPGWDAYIKKYVKK